MRRLQMQKPLICYPATDFSFREKPQPKRKRTTSEGTAKVMATFCLGQGLSWQE